MTRSRSAVPHRDEKTGRWDFLVDVTPDGSKRKMAHRRGFRTKAAAQEALDEIRRSVRKQSFVAPSKMTVDEYAVAWLAGLPATGLRTSTIDGYRRNFLYVTDRVGDKRLEHLSVLDLDGLYGELLASGKRQHAGEGLSPRSVRYVHVTVHKALSDAVRKGILARNVAGLASPPSAKSTRPKEMSWWTPAELRSFLEMTADDSWLLGFQRGVMVASSAHRGLPE